MNQTARLISIVTGVALLLLTVALYTQTESVISLIPWEEGRLTNIFYASIFAAIAVPVIWIGISGERGAAAAGAINLTVVNVGIAVFILIEYIDGEDRLLPYVVFFIVITVVMILVGFWSWRYPVSDTRPVPMPVRISFAVFAIALVITGGRLVLKQDNIMPWVFRNVETPVIVGWIFLGSATYFIYTLLRPGWYYAVGQLLGFLAYDVVLIVPFLRHFDAVPDSLRSNLIFYTIVVSYSGLLAIYYLFVNQSTRIWQPG